MELSEFNTAIDQCMVVDRHRFRRQLQKTLDRQKAQQPIDKMVQRLHTDILSSLDIAHARQARLPAITFPDLPIAEKRDEIIKALVENQVVIVAGETGSGKTTQLPKICLQAGRGIHGQIAHTQPRRIAARTVSQRIAEELQTALGDDVGYQVRFTDQSKSESFIKLMTDGILLAEIQQDPFLNRYDTIIIDEAHERSLNIDFLLGYLKTLLPKRPDLKLIVTSATIDVERFSNHFNNAPIIEVSGRTYPVDIFYRPPLDEFDDMTEAVVASVKDIIEEDKRSDTVGDILVFLTGERDIRETALALRKAHIPHLDILPLYARLSLADQTRVFQAHKGRRVVLATNVAETSITVPGIRYVIDTGLARISRYSFRTKVQRLPIEPISQASANQRAGRAGRLSHGVCFRLYGEDDFSQRPEFTEAELLRSNLASVILQMAQLRLGDIHKFPFVDAPDPKLINDGFKLLEELNALDKHGRLTQLGRQLGKLPIDPRFARMCLAAKQQNCLRELLIIVSGLSVQDPRERPAEKQQAADEKHRRFWDKQSDFLAYVNLWDYVEQQRQDLSQNQFKKVCQREFLSWLRLREWRELHHQLKLAVKHLGFSENTEPASYEFVHRALSMGLLGNIGLLTEERQYLGPRNRKFSIFPSSSQFKATPKWIMSAELLETSKLYAHCVAKVDSDWLLQAAQHLVKRNHFEPHYDSKRGQVMAFERVTLYGLVLVEKKRINYSVVNPTEAREIFIRGALVEMRYRPHTKTPPTFFAHNQKLFEEIEALEAKSRRRDIVVDDQAIYQFYNERLPADIVNQKSFDYWRKNAEKDNPNLLHLTKNILMQHGAEGITEAQFPNQLTVGDLSFPLHYHFEPGKKQDGVNLQVPIHALHLVPETTLEWLVPGLLREKCIEIIKALPKKFRKQFVPVPETVDKLLPDLSNKAQSLYASIQTAASRQLGLDIDINAWRGTTIDDFYLFNIQVIDDNGKVIDQNRNISVLRDAYKQRLQASLRQVGDSFEQSELTDWTFESLPEQHQISKGGVTTLAFPVLLDKESSVDLVLIDNQDQAIVNNQRGISRLLLLQLKQQTKYFRKELFKPQQKTIALLGIGSIKALQDDVLMAAIFSAAKLSENLPRTHKEFESCLEAAKNQFNSRVNHIAKTVGQAIDAYGDIVKQLSDWRGKPAFADVAADIRYQLEDLFRPGFVFNSSEDLIDNLPRFIQGITKRMDKAQGQLNKDLQQIQIIKPWIEKLHDYEEEHPSWFLQDNAKFQTLRWMMQEYRLSLFAQPMKTAMPISEKRMEKQWEKLTS